MGKLEIRLRTYKNITMEEIIEDKAFNVYFNDHHVGSFSNINDLVSFINNMLCECNELLNKLSKLDTKD